MVRVFVVLVLERVRRWVCGLRCPADLAGHMRSICEVSHSASVRSAACQTAAGTACGQRLEGKIRHPTLKKHMENILCASFGQYIKAQSWQRGTRTVFCESGSQRPLISKGSIRKTGTLKSTYGPSLCHALNGFDKAHACGLFQVNLGSCFGGLVTKATHQGFLIDPFLNIAGIDIVFILS